MKRIVIIISLATLCLSGAAYAESIPILGKYGVAPGSEIPQRNSKRFEYLASPGDYIEDSIRLINYDTVAHGFNLDVAKANIGANNSLNCLSGQDTEWIKLESSDIALEPDTSKNLPMSIRVPKQVLPGEYNFCVVVEIDRGNIDKTPGQIKIRPKLSIRLSITVEGKADWRLELASAPVIKANSDSINLSIGLKNSGSYSLDTQVSAISQAISLEAQRNSNTFILPKSVVNATIDDLPKPFWGGLYRLRLNIKYWPAAYYQSSGTTEKYLSTQISYWVMPSAIALVVYLMGLVVSIFIILRVVKRKN